MDGWMDGWMVDGWMDGVQQNLERLKVADWVERIKDRDY